MLLDFQQGSVDNFLDMYVPLSIRANMGNLVAFNFHENCC